MCLDQCFLTAAARPLDDWLRRITASYCLVIARQQYDIAGDVSVIIPRY